MPLLLLAVIGISTQRRWTPSVQLSLAFAAVFLLSYAFMSPYARYAMPVVPIAMLFASHGLTNLIDVPFLIKSRAERVPAF